MDEIINVDYNAVRVTILDKKPAWTVEVQSLLFDS